MDLFVRQEPGPEPTLLFVHGFPFDGRMWEPQVEGLRGKFRLLIPDLAGFGRSPLPEPPPSIEGQAELLEKVMGDAGISRAVLCGLSMGGYIALAFAARFPGRLAGLILADTRAAADSEEGKAMRSEAARRVLLRGPGFLADSMPEKLLAPRAMRTKPELVRQIRDLILAQPSGGVAGALLAMRDRPERTGGLGRISCQTLVLCGDEDTLTPPPEMRAVAAAISGACYAEIPAAGHLSNLENPDDFNHKLTGFLEHLEPGN